MSEHLRPVRGSIAAASAALIVLTLTGCVQAETQTATEPSAVPSSEPTEPSTAPTPTVEPLVLPECETLIPLVDVREFAHEWTELLQEDDAVPFREMELAELEPISQNATTARRCLWGLPSSEYGFEVTVAGVSENDAANLMTALRDEGFSEQVAGSASTFEFLTVQAGSDFFTSHYFDGDLWLRVAAPPYNEFAADVTARVLEQIRVANPTRAY
ncbi:hypothetical protein I6E68_01855 [Salinibacterium sp. NSLL150]|uniref:hypothetical protein n=1 Tax=unclassified Salinibacterium TaxID=2632331 RepID=UPI0018CCD5E4|nr:MULTISPECIES: hypothetical protein [unclassified Salinibacterium]MBH0097879.1 hypothetical protein [Salinibacterium sp. NSLL35]MBH0100634.1 hypothetical protein [Salinibacterium sp. NSLL150]MBH0103393.1 hypothetical protein [Salinibacterium sp. NSLL16]MBH0106154.1 hypothetical protein [Salinibacterium sp. NSLL17]